MAIGNLTIQEFQEKLAKVLKPTGPIASIEMLFGREKNITDLQMALYSVGRHAFIYGDRGVGKTSLAHTIAYQMQEQAEPILVGCSPDSTLFSVIKDILNKGLSSNNKTKLTKALGINILGINASYSKEIALEDSEINVNDVSSAASAITFLIGKHSTIPYIVIDEFDQIKSDHEKQKFGMLIKQLGDQYCNIKIIFTGIGHSLQDLIGGHLSSERHIHQVHLEPIPWNARFSIIDKAFDEFGVSVEENIKFKIAGLSDGFPHYIHLICEKILIAIFLNEKEIRNVNFKIFLDGLNDAVNSIAESLRTSYALATAGREECFHHILWAMADTADLIRMKSNIYLSYAHVCKSLAIIPLDKNKFDLRFSNLRKDSHGELICLGLNNRAGWYRFKENMLRGYVRMVAELNGVTLDFETNQTASIKTASSSAKTRIYAPYTAVEYRLIKGQEGNE